MNRRDFIKHIALMAAGASALPEQLQAFEAYYFRNTPLIGEPFICIDEVTLCGLSTVPSPLRFDIFDGDNNVLAGGLNAFGGMFYWRALGDHKIMAPLRTARWKIVSVWGDEWIRNNLNGSVSYIDQDGIRVKKQITQVESSL